MEILIFSINSVFIAFICCLLAGFFTLRSKSKSKSNTTGDGDSGGEGDGGGGGGEVMEVEKVTEPSIMERLVPEITTHALSYLDFPSLCRLSMTNSFMRTAANDDNAWKALYHKDFTMEQGSIRPANGWKAYYAATRAVMNANAQFFNVIREGSLERMSSIWLKADYVTCFLASGAFFTGYRAVMESWKTAFNWDDGGVDLQIREVKTRVQADVAWVITKAYYEARPSTQYHVTNVTNVFEFHNGKWYLVHHHSAASSPPNAALVV